MPQLAGETILASDIAPVRFVQKAAIETVTSSATLQNDDDLVLIPMAANKIYRVEVRLACTSTAVGINTQWVLAGGVAQLSTKSNQGIGPAATSVSAATTVRVDRSNITTAVPWGAGWTAGQTAHLEQEFLIETTTSGTAGTITLQWCQVTSNASGTALTTGSYLIITEVEAA